MKIFVCVFVFGLFFGLDVFKAVFLHRDAKDTNAVYFQIEDGGSAGWTYPG